MFYADTVLTKQGPLARIWLAAHWDKKLTKGAVFETDLETACESVVNPGVKVALRTSGHLLLGVVRIYNRKSKYLLADCNEAYVKIRLAFRGGLTIDLPVATTTNKKSGNNQVFIPTEMDMVTMPEITTAELQRALLKNTARYEEITLKPDTISLAHGSIFKDIEQNDYGFGGCAGFDTTDIKDSNFSTNSIENVRKEFGSDGKSLSAIDRPLDDEDLNIDDELAKCNVDDNDLFPDSPNDLMDDENDQIINEPVPKPKQDVELLEKTNQGDIDFPEISAIQSPSKFDDPPDTPMEKPDSPIDSPMPQMMDEDPIAFSNPNTPAPFIPPGSPQVAPIITPIIPDKPIGKRGSLVLAPIDQQAYVKPKHHKRNNKKRSLIVDSSMEITNSQMKEQLKDYSDIVFPLDTNYDWLAPPTVRLVQWTEKGTVDPLFKDGFLGAGTAEKEKWLDPLCYTKLGENFENLKINEKRKNSEALNVTEDLNNNTLSKPKSTNEQPKNFTLESNTIPSGNPEISNISTINQSIPKDIETARLQLSDINVSSVNISTINATAETLHKSKISEDGEPQDKRQRLDNEQSESKLNLTTNNVSVLNDTVEQQNKSLNLNPASVPPLSPAKMIDPDHMFDHIDFKEIDDDKKRDICMLNMIQSNMDYNKEQNEDEFASFFTIAQSQDRKRAARQFYSVLVLRKQKIIEVEQEGPCLDIKITKNENYEKGKEIVQN